jgi:Lon protease-like protein
MRNPFTPKFDRLPLTLPIFPLANGVVMPGTQLPLNIFEPRYLNMTLDSLAAERMIGTIQPNPEERSSGCVFRTGTAGRITQFMETNDGRLLIVLTGICRFDIQEELSTTRGYRRVVANWGRFQLDYQEQAGSETEHRSVIALLKPYFARKALETDWAQLETLDLSILINVLTNQLPLNVAERQSLVEAVTLDDRVRMLTGLLQVGLVEDGATPETRH